MPRLHPQVGDWLCTPSEPCGQQPADHSAFSWNIPSSISQLSDSASSGSLHRWLLDIQNDADNNDDGDDGFELITRSGDQSGKRFIVGSLAINLLFQMTTFDHSLPRPSLPPSLPSSLRPSLCYLIYLCSLRGSQLLVTFVSLHLCT